MSDESSNFAEDVCGFYCPECRGVRPLLVTKTYPALPGRIDRYRECGVCGFRIVSRERFLRKRPPRSGGGGGRQKTSH